MHLPDWMVFNINNNESKKIVFHDEGHVDWSTPVFGKYGGKNGGMFGTVIKHLSAAGYDVHIDSISEESLENAAALTLINSNRQFTDEEKKLVWSFVKKGGGLLILGDHTGMEHIRKPFNDLLLPVNIHFNFDSAMSMVPKWTNGFVIKPHYITKNIRDENDLQIWIGASLSVSYPAKPLILGKYAFSDKGSIKAQNMGYLGDMRYVPGEKLGNLPLVAVSNFGDGKVIVFGDTSSFQNSAIFLSADFVQRIYSWLSTKAIIFYPYNMLLTSLAFLSLAIYFTFNKPFIHLITMVLTVFLALIVLIGNTLQHKLDYQKPVMKVPVALIDASHRELLSLDAWGDQNGFGGLVYNLERNGYLPIVMRDFNHDELLNSKLFIIMAPTKEFSFDEIKTLNQFLNKGGQLILAVGWEEKESCRNLLKYFKIDIDNIPLGRILSTQNTRKLSFNNAWPISFEDDDTEILTTVWGYPVAILKVHGKGRLLIVGGGSFFLNKNLEGLYNYSIDNIQFLKEILSDKFSRDGSAQ
jgi:hypothetical protein